MRLYQYTQLLASKCFHEHETQSLNAHNFMISTCVESDNCLLVGLEFIPLGPLVFFHGRSFDWRDGYTISCFEAQTVDEVIAFASDCAYIGVGTIEFKVNN